MVNSEQKKDIVVAITVTYNRTRTLSKCLEALLTQSRPVDKILIVDNRSNNEENQKLKKLAAQSHKIDLLVLKENLGGAGGFEAGMKAAMEKWNPHWYWLMDDDAYPRRDCLEILLSHAEIFPEAGGFCPAIYGVDLKKYQLFHHKKMTKIMLKSVPVSSSYEEMQDVTEEDANAFVGPLFPKKVVSEIGIADGSLFIYGDDTEYTHRVSAAYPLYLIKNAIIDHQDAPVLNENMKPEGWWKEYYGNRNQYFIIREFHKNNVVRFAGYFCFTLRLLAIMLKSIIKGYNILRIKLIAQAIKDGLKNRRGKTLDPQKYYDYLAKHL
ncbi:MAG: glycosyltransferase [Hungatella sp.]|jgi:GT2 family glycosyltransferase|nr:glycosyltransferase [Hungatella sp.]